MAFRALFSPHAVKAYRELSADKKGRIDEAMLAVIGSPTRGPQIKRLKGHLKDYYRCRVGELRIIYAVSTQKREVCVDYLDHRKGGYRRLS